MLVERIIDCRGVGPGPAGGAIGYGARNAGPDMDIRPVLCEGFLIVEGTGRPEREP